MQDEEKIEEQYNEATALTASAGRSIYPGMTYEQGVRDALAWVLEESDEAPFEVDD